MLIDHYAQLGEYKLLEQCIVQLNPKCLDMNQVFMTVTVCMYSLVSKVRPLHAWIACMCGRLELVVNRFSLHR